MCKYTLCIHDIYIYHPFNIQVAWDLQPTKKTSHNNESNDSVVFHGLWWMRHSTSPICSGRTSATWSLRFNRSIQKYVSSDVFRGSSGGPLGRCVETKEKPEVNLANLNSSPQQWRSPIFIELMMTIVWPFCSDVWTHHKCRSQCCQSLRLGKTTNCKNCQSWKQIQQCIEIRTTCNIKKHKRRLPTVN